MIPLELRVIGQVQHEHAPGGIVCIHHAADREQVIAVMREVVINERAEIANRPCQSVELHHD